MTTTTAIRTHGSYELVPAPMTGQMMIRGGQVGRKRTVAFLDSEAQWERFVDALKAGADEVAAVFAIDEKKR